MKRQQPKPNFVEIQKVQYQISQFKIVDLAGTENRKGIQKEPKTPHLLPDREHPAIEVSPKSPCGAFPLEDVPANSRTQKMAQKMKKVRCLHSLHVPPRECKTR